MLTTALKATHTFLLMSQPGMLREKKKRRAGGHVRYLDSLGTVML
jgi:hypothetical protein